MGKFVKISQEPGTQSQPAILIYPRIEWDNCKSWHQQYCVGFEIPTDNYDWNCLLCIPVACVASAKRGGGGEKGEKCEREKARELYLLSPIILSCFLPPLPLPLSMPATQATCRRSLVTCYCLINQE